MEFGVYFTHQLPRPWSAQSEYRAFSEALDQVELADELGFDYAWVVEQHFLEEYSHSSAPEVFLAAASQRTRRIRLGHGIALLPPGYSHPARLAERVSTLDLLSGGRIDFGIGDSKSRMELEGFGIEAADRRAMTLEAAEQIANMMVFEPYQGHSGQFSSMPARNVIPKPLQKPHPPMWMACSDNAAIELAAKLGIGALAHAFFDADEAGEAVRDYYETFKRECVPIGHAVNPAVATLIPFYCHESADVARDVGMSAHGFFTYAARHYYSFGRHRPGYTDLAAQVAHVQRELGGDIPLRGSHAIGTPDYIAGRLRELAAAGVDQVILLHDAGGLTGEEKSRSLELFAAEVMPRFVAGRPEQQRCKQQELEGHVQAAFERKKPVAAPSRDQVRLCDAYGLSRPDVELATLDALPASSREIVMDLQKLKAAALKLDP
jgi:alkanesulfonate monooxygenase SsuD/methylene tetrahydromethanopterin reductase-like flavin-dependent oxidoreductase (luciferase family)